MEADGREGRGPSAALPAGTKFQSVLTVAFDTFTTPSRIDRNVREAADRCHSITIPASMSPSTSHASTLRRSLRRGGVVGLKGVVRP